MIDIVHSTLAELMGPLSTWWSSFASSAYARTTSAYATSFVLGTLIGLERQWRQRSAGLRTNVLVAIGAAAFSDVGMRLLGAEGATRIISYIVSGIGFLGAGVILKDRTNIRGLNTAATLWRSAAVGTLAGSGLSAEAATLAGFVLAGNTLLRPLVNWTCPTFGTCSMRSSIRRTIRCGRSRHCPTMMTRWSWRPS